MPNQLCWALFLSTLHNFTLWGRKWDDTAISIDKAVNANGAWWHPRGHPVDHDRLTLNESDVGFGASGRCSSSHITCRDRHVNTKVCRQ